MIFDEAAASAASSCPEEEMTDEAIPMITLDDKSYAVSDLSQTARDTLQLLQFAEAQLRHLRDELAVSQTAQMAYARALKVDLEQGTGEQTE